jgi:hypothetical protein
MRWVVFGIALILATAVLKMLPRYEIVSIAAGGVGEIDKWTGSVRSCGIDSCGRWFAIGQP